MPKLHHQRPTRETSPAPPRAKLAEAEPARAIPLGHLAPGAVVQRALAAPRSLRPAELMAIQRTLGNRAAGAILGRTPIQAKLIVNAPGDEYEREADRVAEQVMRMPAPPREELDEHQKLGITTQSAIQRSGDGAVAAGGGFEQQLGASRGRGQPLPSGLKSEFEARFGVDFSGVTIHTDAQADGLNRSIQAEAFTQGRDIYFASGQFGPNRVAGKRLLAHELTHVVQQNGEIIHKAHSNRDRPVINQLDDQAAIQRQIKIEKYKAHANKELKKAFKQYESSQVGKQGFETHSKGHDAARVAELEALQMIEVLANEWLATPEASKKNMDAKIIRELISDVTREFDEPDIQRMEHAQYTKRLEDTQAFFGNFASAEKGHWLRFKYITKEGVDALNPVAALQKAEEAKKSIAAARKQIEQAQGAVKKAPTDAETKAAAYDLKRANNELEEAEEIKKKAENPSKTAFQYGLTFEELLAIRLYTAGDYKYINPVLVNDPAFLESSLKTVGAAGASGETTWAATGVEKGLGNKGVRHDLRMEAMQHTRRVLAGLAKLPNACTLTYRGLALTPTELGKYKEGNKTPPWAAFSSTTTKRELAEGYAKRRAISQGQGKLAVLFISMVTHGKDLKPISLYAKEGEILLLPGAEFTVTQNDRKEKNGVYEVYLQQTASGQKHLEKPAVNEPRMMKEYYEERAKILASLPYHNWPVEALEKKYIELVGFRAHGIEHAHLREVSREMLRKWDES